MALVKINAYTRFKLIAFAHAIKRGGQHFAVIEHQDIAWLEERQQVLKMAINKLSVWRDMQ